MSTDNDRVGGETVGSGGVLLVPAVPSLTSLPQAEERFTGYPMGCPRFTAAGTG